MAEQIEHDLSKLPRWARIEIERLRANVAYLEQKVSAGPDNSDTFADPYSETPTPLGSGTMIEFGDPQSDSGAWDVRIVDNELQISQRSPSARSLLAVIPWSSSSIRIRSAKL